MEAQVLKSLGKLKKLLPRNQKELKDAIDVSTLAMTSALEHQTKATTSSSGGLTTITQVPFEPFLLAILTRQAKLVAIALDCIEKFLAFGFLQGNGVIPETIRKRLIQKHSKGTTCPLSPTGGGTISDDSLVLEEHWKLIDCIIEVICDANDHPDETVQIQVLRVLLTAVTTSTCEVHEHSLLKAVRACYHIHLVSKTHTNQTVAKATLQQIISIVFQRMETFDQRVQEETEAVLKTSRMVIKASTQAVWYPDVKRSLEYREKPMVSNTSSSLFAPSFPSVLHKDAFLLFRSLCRISMRSIAEDTSNMTTPLTSSSSSSSSSLNGGGGDDPFAFQSKLLSLELILSILIHAGPSFRQGERFIHAIRQYLCQSLLQNCTSNYLQIVDVSLQLFMVLIQQFKQFLKSEMAIFITSIFLKLIQSEHATIQHKLLVMNIIHQMCQNATLLGEIFLNYDCDWSNIDLFKQMMDVIAKMAKGNSKTKGNADVLVLKGLECLTATVLSLQTAAQFQEHQQQLKITSDIDEETLPLPPLPPLPLPPPPTSSAVEAFDRKKRRQEEIATGILQFNVKPTTGIQYLLAHGHLNQGTPRDVAFFLHENAHRLDKTQVGDYLGREAQYQNGFCLETLHEYIDLLDFSHLEIDVAIRLFLSGFRLPGESQKIDRMMEKFAQRYFNCCPIGLFPSADTAFILSFSIIMLQTDLHNPSIPEEKKMTKEGFIRNNRGIKNGEDLPEEYLSGIYDRIKQTPISLKEDVELKNRLGTSSSSNTSGLLFGPSSAVVDRQRRDAYSKERESMVRASEALFKRRMPGSTTRKAIDASSSSSSSSSSVFYLLSGTEQSHIKPMFETIWAPLLACCSVLFESQEVLKTIQLCLQAFQAAIHLSSRFEMKDERDAFVSVLCKFTALHTTGSRLLKPKHMEAIKVLLSVAVVEGNYLGDAWRDILQCLSQLARLQTHAQGLEFESSTVKRTSLTSSHSTTTLSSSSSSSSALRRGFLSPNHASTTTSPSLVLNTTTTTNTNNPEEEAYNQQIQDENATCVLIEIEAVAMDRVFSSSVALSDHAIQEFVISLCVVSLSECSGVLNPSSSSSSSFSFSSPRVFSLQKLVEVADMNMLIRSRMVWSSTWTVLSRHFTTIGCHETLEIAMYAIDSLRQLSMRFLEKAELKDFNFQRLFLTPFEIIMANAQSMDIKELILRCIENIILARAETIKSGWKTIWGVLRVAAETFEQGSQEEVEKEKEKEKRKKENGRGSCDRIVQLGFQIASRLLESHFERQLEVFVDAVECLVAFAVCGQEKRAKDPVWIHMSLSSIDLLSRTCLDKMAMGYVIEKVFVESTGLGGGGTGGKRIGFTTRKEEGKKGRYEKQESLRSLEEEIDAKSPPPTPSHVHRRSTVTSTPPTDVTQAIYTDCAAHTRMWWPVLTALSTLAADHRLDVRLSALLALCRGLETHGKKLSSGLWSLIFKGVLIPLLDELRHVEIHIEQSSSSLLLADRFTRHQQETRTSTQCLEWILHLYGLYYDQVGFLPEIIFILGKCMDATDVEEELATAAASALEEMLKTHGHKFPEDVWGLIADEFRSVMTRAEPTWVFFCRPTTTTKSSPLSPRVPSLIAMYPSVPRCLGIQFASTFPPKIVTQEEIRAQERPCQTHLVVILALQQLIATVLTSRETRQLSLSEGHATSLVSCLRESFRFARKLNDAFVIRQDLAAQGWTYGRVTSTDVPNVLWQEVGGKESYGRVLFHGLKADVTLESWKRDEWRRQMRVLVESTLEEYLRWTVRGEEEVDRTQRVVRYTPLMVSLLNQLAQLSSEEMRRHLHWVYPLLTELIQTSNEQVRTALTRVFTQSIGQLLPLTPLPASPTNITRPE